MNEQSVLQIQSDSRATVATVLCREFDYERTGQFKTELAGAAGNDAKLPLILDITNVGYMPSLTLGTLVELRNRSSREQRPLMLVGLQPPIVELMQKSGILSLFDVRTNVADAMKV